VLEADARAAKVDDPRPDQWATTFGLASKSPTVARSAAVDVVGGMVEMPEGVEVVPASWNAQRVLDARR